MVLQTSAEMLKKSHASSPIGQIKPAVDSASIHMLMTHCFISSNPPLSHVNRQHEIKVLMSLHLLRHNSNQMDHIVVAPNAQVQIVGDFFQDLDSCSISSSIHVHNQRSNLGFIYLLVSLFIYMRNL